MIDGQVSHSDWPNFQCEGCGLIAVERSLPSDWSQFGTSTQYRTSRGNWKLASWCADCSAGKKCNGVNKTIVQITASVELRQLAERLHDVLQRPLQLGKDVTQRDLGVIMRCGEIAQEIAVSARPRSKEEL